jgi:multiple sugar transport system substrate-binding protein
MRVTVFLAVSLTFVTAIAFGSGQSADAKAGTGGVEEITILCQPTTADFGKMWELAANIFNTKFAGKYNAKLLPQPGDIQEVAMRQFASGLVVFDVYPIHTTFYSSHTSYALPLDDLIKKDKFDLSPFGNTIGQHSRDGKVYGFPWRSFFHVSFFRSDLYKDAGLAYPKNVNEILPAARKMTKKNAAGDVEHYGYALPFGDGFHAMKKLQQWIENPGGRIMNDQLTAASDYLTSPKAVEVIKIMKALKDEGLVPDPISLKGGDETDAAKLGRLAHMDNWSAYAAIVEQPTTSKTAGKWDYAPNIMTALQLGPKPTANSLSGWGVGIAKASKHPQAAFEYIKILTGKEAQKQMALQFRNGPSRMDLFDDPDVQKLFPLKTQTIAKGFAEATLFENPPVTKADIFRQIVMEEGQAMFLNKITPEQMLANISNKINNAMK